MIEDNIEMDDEDYEGDLVDEINLNTPISRPTELDYYRRELDPKDVKYFSGTHQLKDMERIKEQEAHCEKNGFENGVLVKHVKVTNVTEMIKRVEEGKLTFFGQGDTKFDARDYILKT